MLTQGFGYENSGQNTQPSLTRPLQPAPQQRPYSQAAGVDHAQPADARPPPQQQVPLQQIPFFPQPMARGQPVSKPTLFVPGQPSAHSLPASGPPPPTQPVPAPAASQALPQARQTPAVSSRLLALKARLDTDRPKGGEPSKTARSSPLTSAAAYVCNVLHAILVSKLTGVHTDPLTSSNRYVMQDIV